MPGRWMIYSHDALGLGHVRRSLSIARAVLAARTDVAALLVTCSPMVDALPVAPGLDYIKLPSLRKLGNQSYASRSLPIDGEKLRAFRVSLLKEVARHFEPDVLLVDKSPAGLMGELASTLEGERSRARPGRLVLGLRDILDEPAAVADEWQSRDLVHFVERHYHEIWIYGDRALFDAPAAYGWPMALAARVRYLGYLVPSVSEAARRAARDHFGADGEPLALVTAGGGEDGADLIANYLRAAAGGLLPRDLRSLVVLGPCMPPETQAALVAQAPAGVRVEAFVSDLAPAIAAADVVVGMAGYNTVCELLAGGTPAVLVPRTRPRREQWLRAQGFAARGLAQMLEPEHLEPRSLAGAVHRALERGRMNGHRPAADGLEQVVRQMERILPAARPSVASAGPAAAGGSSTGDAAPSGSRAAADLS